MIAGTTFEEPRRRAAVLFADLVESVRLYQHHEAQTIRRWRQVVEHVRQAVAGDHGGRLVRTVGDGLLMLFPDPARAMAAALALHADMVRMGAPTHVDADDAMVLRVGLHAADVVEDDHDLWGSGVNIAARLATLAQPGQSVGSAAFRGALDDGVQADIVDLGERHLKNLSEPVRVFALAPPGGSPRHALPRSEDLRPCVAVVPFCAMPPDARHDALGHVVADEVIASLSRHGSLRVLSRHSTAAVRGVDLPPARLRELLGATFLLSGRFYVHGSQLRVQAELSELQRGEVVWAGSAAADVDALFAGQDELVPHLVAQVSQRVLAHELARVRALPLDALASYSLLLGAQGLLHSLVPADGARAHEVLEHLSERHPRSAAPRAVMSEWHIVQFSQGRASSPQAAVQAALACAEGALERDPDHPDALVALGVASSFARRDYAGAEDHYRRALAGDPGHPQAWARLSEALSETGHHAESLAAAHRAIALSPLDPRRFFYECAAARTAYMMEHFELAIEHARLSIRMNALHAPAHRLLVAAQWKSDLREEARRSAADYVRLLPAARAHGTPLSGAGTTAPSPFEQVLRAAGVPV